MRVVTQNIFIYPTLFCGRFLYLKWNDFDYNGKLIGINEEQMLITVNEKKIKINFNDFKTFFKSKLIVEFYKKKDEEDIK